MGVLMMTVRYPFHKFQDVSAKGMLDKLPDSIKKWRFFSTSDGEKGIKVYHLIYTQDGKLEDAGLFIAQYQGTFSDIEGYNFKIEMVMSNTDMQKIFQT